MGLLADIYSGSDSLKRKVKGLLADPLGTIEQKINQFGEDQQAAINNAQDATGFGGNRSVLMSAQQKQQASKALGDYAGSMGLAGMFVGQGSSTWNKAEADKALKMAQSGTDPRKIWSETGNWKGPDGAWRQEIPDNMAKSRDYQLTPAKAFQQARFNAAIDDSQMLRDRAESMAPYWHKTKNQLTDEYSETGSAIVDAALSGNKEQAMQLSKDRGGLSSLLEEMRNTSHGPTSSFLKHGELGKAYPDVYKMHTRIDSAGNTLDGAKGHYNRGNAHQGEQIVLKEKPVFADGKSIQLHEIQHAIQQREGWAKGGSPDGLSGALANDAFELRKQARKLDDSAWRNDPLGPSELLKPGARKKALAMEKQASDLESWASRIDEFGDGYANTAYKNLAGEAEARATQARIPLDAAQRRALFPEDSYDVPMNQLIIRGLLAK